MYAYTGGDPVNSNDARGLCWTIVSSGNTTWADYYDCPEDYPGTYPARPAQPVNTIGQYDEIHGTGPAYKQIDELYDVAIDPRGANILKQVYGMTNGLTSPMFYAGWAGSALVAGAVGAGGLAVFDAIEGGIAVELGVAGGPGTTAVIGSGAALAGPLGPDGSKLMEVAEGAYSWALNQSILQNVMSSGNAIRDVSVDAAGNLLDITNQYLGLERQMLQDAGWTLQQAENGYWQRVKPSIYMESCTHEPRV